MISVNSRQIMCLELFLLFFLTRHDFAELKTETNFMDSFLSIYIDTHIHAHIYTHIKNSLLIYFITHPNIASPSAKHPDK